MRLSTGSARASTMAAHTTGWTCGWTTGVEGLGQLSNDTITRERRTLHARYQLVDVQSGAIVLDATAGSDAGFDVVNSEYAVIAAEQTALENLSQEIADQIVTRVSLRLREAK